MKYITLFWEILIFIPFFLLLYFVNLDNVVNYWVLWNIVDFLANYIWFLSRQQIYVWVLFAIYFLLLETIWWVVKYFFFKPRPKPMSYSNWYKKILASSFPSLHSARTFGLFLFSYFYTNLYVAFGFLLFWALISYSRVYLKKHFWIDICGGIVFSVVIFTFIYLVF